MTTTDRPEARVSYLPYSTGDGYGYGGGAVLTIGGLALPIGENRDAAKVAERIAWLWNTNRDTPDPPAPEHELF
jgi:hypothetical protein